MEQLILQDWPHPYKILPHRPVNIERCGEIIQLKVNSKIKNTAKR